MAENKLQLFKKNDIIIELNGKKEKIVYDMYAVLELENLYGSIDTVFRMLFGQVAANHIVKVNGQEVDVSIVTVDDTPLIQHLQVRDNEVKATIKDTVNILWIGLLHSHAKWDDDGDIISCDITKNDIIKGMSFKEQLAEINTQVVGAIIRDLIAPDEKNEEENKGELKN